MRYIIPKLVEKESKLLSSVRTFNGKESNN